MHHAGDPSCLVLLFGHYLSGYLKLKEMRKSREKRIAGEEMKRESRKEENS